NSGATGTRAFYELLAETGRKVVRWQEPPDALLNNKNAPKTFVVIGKLKREFTEAETAKLLEWISTGGKLVIIDREPPAGLIVPNANWRLKFNAEDDASIITIDPSDATQMTAQTVAAIPVQPTVYTVKLNSVQPSRLASSIIFERFDDSEPKLKTVPAKPTPTSYDDEDYSDEEYFKPTPKPSPVNTPKVFQSNKVNGAHSKYIFQMPQSAPPPPPPPIKTETKKADSPQLTEDQIISAPVLHLANKDKNFLVDIPYGAGKIVYLSDPFIVSNGGLKLSDNVQLGINLVASREGLIAFDEYHQGFGSNTNRFLEYFAGTPVVSIFIQVALLVLLLFISQSIRFARPVPEKEEDRLSKLEYVSAMAELQQRTKAFDLALENIYNDFRRRVARSFGVDNFTVTRKELANLIAERTKLDRNDVEDVMFKCEEIIHGERTNKTEVTKLAARLREFEEKLGLQRQKRQRNVV
ncbi:MAG TPA: DUF4350 domain-containing protein, partial [Pyrinomonadaceae bacterium]|nr:DUF4350 domain-containing protein [Pyrinomonadaceae bacterium]